MNQHFQPPITETQSSAVACYHCSLSVPAPGEFSSFSSGETQDFCCAGCMAITKLIESGGLEHYYTSREQPGTKPDSDLADIYDIYDKQAMQSGWVERDTSVHSGELLIEEIRCAACVWLIESWLTKLPGVESAYVSLSNARLTVTWSPERLKVSEIFRHLYKIGYTARPYTQANKELLLSKQRDDLLKRLGIAGVFGMQVMVLSIALYAGNWFGIEQQFRSFLTRVNLLLVLPILLYAAKPFFENAWRSIKAKSIGMDIPVSIGLSLAFVGSGWATISNTGSTYFDSIAMFVFFLLGARYLELTARIKGSSAMDSLANAVPEYATCYPDKNLNKSPIPIATGELKVGDYVLIKPGAVSPADGIILDQASTFDESLLTGEHHALLRSVGDQVLSGSINIEQAVSIRVNRSPDGTALSSIMRLAKQSNQGKPKISLIAERTASWFILAVLLTASIVAISGIINGADNWLETTIAVLVVTCPCALSLATPLAITASINSLMKRGVYVANQHAIETMSKVDHIIFDKTGTITNGKLQLTHVDTSSSLSSDACLRIAASLEQYSEHPIAKSLIQAHEKELLETSDIHIKTGFGLSGTINNIRYSLGSYEYILTQLDKPHDEPTTRQISKKLGANHQSVVLLCSSSEVLAMFMMEDHVRRGAHSLVSYLVDRDIEMSIQSGDRTETVATIASQLNIKAYKGNCKPDQKLAQVNQLIEQGKAVCMVGDGINDTPALSGAHLSVAYADKVNLAAANADVILTNSSISTLQLTHAFSLKTANIIRQNITWALLYNLCAVPAAVMGFVPPWLAGIGMSLSSAIVVINASRLTTIPDYEMQR